jgi:hypothetical protein
MCVRVQAYNALCLCGTKTQVQKNCIQDRIADRIAAVRASRLDLFDQNTFKTGAGPPLAV